MINNFEVKLCVNLFEAKETRIKFINSLAQSHNSKIQHITLKMEEIDRD